MKICICGWYFNPYFLSRVKASGYEAHIISHKGIIDVGILIISIDNIGLEWGAYDFYLKNVWYAGDVLFCHDDTVVDSTEVFNQIAELGKTELDCIFIFNDHKDELNSQGSFPHGLHGRAFFCKERLLKKLILDNDGFEYDHNNNGFNTDPLPEGMEHANYGIFRFWDFLKREEIKSGVAYYPEWHNARRGKFKKVA